VNTSTPPLTHAPPPSAAPRPLAPRREISTSPDRPTWGEVFDERAPIIGAPAFFGPPVVFVLGPWLLLVLLVIGPFALALTVLLALTVVVALLAAVVAVIASPYLLMRHLHAHGTVDVDPSASPSLFRKYRIGPGRLGSPQPKGIS
jgi:hypothetical protein